MSFFKEIYERIGDYTLSLTIQRDKGQLVVMLVPKLEAKKDDALKEIIPLTVKGTPDQLDAGFILAISQGISLTTGLQTNIKEFEAGLKKAEKKLKGKDEKKDDKKTDTKVEDVKDDDDDDDDDDNKTDEDQIPFGDDKVDTNTGEIKEPAGEKQSETKKAPEAKAKSVEPKAKEPKAVKEEKIPEPESTALSGEITKTDEDEW
jgi:PRTRC genetic system protein E